MNENSCRFKCTASGRIGSDEQKAADKCVHEYNSVEMEKNMSHNEKKLANIIEELTMFFFSVGARDIQSGIHVEGRYAEIEFTADYQPGHSDRLDSLEKYFNEPKNEALEDFYWELTGTGDPGESSQLLMVGMMIDKADVEIGKDKVRLKLYKELDL